MVSLGFRPSAPAANRSRRARTGLKVLFLLVLVDDFEIRIDDVGLFLGLLRARTAAAFGGAGAASGRTGTTGCARGLRGFLRLGLHRSLRRLTFLRAEFAS